MFTRIHHGGHHLIGVGGVGGPFSGPPESRGWGVIFDWPLGGLSYRAVLREPELEVIPRL